MREANDVTMLAEPSEAELVGRSKGGDLMAFETLVTRHERQVYTLARRITGHEADAEDVTQQTFMSALQHLDGFRGEASFATWLHRIATHAALKLVRKRKGTVSLEDPAGAQEIDGPIPHPEFIADWRQSPMRLAELRETGRLLDLALGRLSERLRLVFVLRDVQGFSVKETAAELHMSEANVKVRLLRARLQLREELTRAFGEPARQERPVQPSRAS